MTKEADVLVHAQRIANHPDVLRAPKLLHRRARPRIRKLKAEIRQSAVTVFRRSATTRVGVATQLEESAAAGRGGAEARKQICVL